MTDALMNSLRWGEPLSIAVLAYFCLVWLVSVIMTIADKRRAKRRAWRVPESTLLLFGALGGAVPMLITMKVIRHKTLHKKFMIGLPVIILLHIILAFFIIYLLTKSGFWNTIY